MERKLQRAVGRARIAASIAWLEAPLLLEHEHELLCERLGLGEKVSLRDARLAYIAAYRRPPLYALHKLASGDSSVLRFWAWRLFRRARPHFDPLQAAQVIFLELPVDDLRRLLIVGDPQEVVAAMVGAPRDQV